MADKLEKIGQELEKARERQKEWTEKVQALEERYRETENARICEITRAASLTPTQLARLIEMCQTSLPGTFSLEETPCEAQEKGEPA